MAEHRTRDDLLRELARRAGLSDAEIDGYLGAELGGELDAVAVVTCMGRLRHLKQTLPTLLEHTPGRVVVVEWSCPDQCGTWAQAQDKRIWIERVPGERQFHKTAALNVGCRAALELGARWLLVLDADTLIRPRLWEWLGHNLPRDAFAFVQGHEARRDLSGLLVVRAEDYQRSGGYDERMIGWGCEDLDMRLRLHLKLGLPFVQIPWQLAAPIAHDDQERTRFQDGDRVESHKRNYQLMSENVHDWTGSHLHQLDRARVRRVFGGMW